MRCEVKEVRTCSISGEGAIAAGEVEAFVSGVENIELVAGWADILALQERPTWKFDVVGPARDARCDVSQTGC